MSDKKYPRGWGKYKKLTKGWEKYIFDQLYPKFVKEFPTTKGMTQAKVSKWLVDQDWYNTIKVYTYKSYVASGMTDMTFREYVAHLARFNTYDGKKINAWKNSQVHSVARNMVNRLKKGARHFNERLTKLQKTDSVAYLKQLSTTMVEPPKGFSKRLRNLEIGNMTDAQYKKELNYVKAVIEKDIIEKQVPLHTKDTFDKVNNFQGKRISQDQLQYGNNKILEEEKTKHETKIDGSGEELILEGQWFLSPSHKKHYFKGGDPCKKFAKQRYFYGEDIPEPVKDSHFGCRCRVELKVITKSQMHK